MSREPTTLRERIQRAKDGVDEMIRLWGKGRVPSLFQMREWSATLAAALSDAAPEGAAPEGTIDRALHRANTDARFTVRGALALLDEPAAPASGDGLPPLPTAKHNAWPHGWHDLYTAEQMRAYALAALASPTGVDDYQERVGRWMDACFPLALYGDMTQRCDRFLEESLELLQAQGYDRTRVATLVDYVWNRPAGEPRQEVGGTVVTLAALCWVAGIDMQSEALRELARIEQPAVMAKIQAKQQAKNALHFDSPLPGDGANA